MEHSKPSLDNQILNLDDAVVKSHTYWDSPNKSILFDVPLGFVGQGSLWFTNTAPAGWLICDGSSLLRSDYSRLFAVIGTTYGAADGTHFTLPDLRSRVPMGTGTGTGLSSRTLAANVGAESATTNSGNAGVVLAGADGGVRYVWNQTNGNHTHSVSTVSPALVINFIIKF